MTSTPLAPEDLLATITAKYEELAWMVKPLLIIIAVLFVWSFVLKIARKFKRVYKDGERLYTSRDRRIGFARAGNRCEMDGYFWFLRCKREAKHGDHHYPHSRGGATSMQNFVAACVRCNTSKGAKIPTRSATKRMERRRRKYFPKGVPVTVGERLTQQSSKYAPQKSGY